MSLGRNIQGGQAMMVLSIDQPVTEDIINELYDVGGFDKIYGTTLSQITNLLKNHDYLLEIISPL